MDFTRDFLTVKYREYGVSVHEKLSLEDLTLSQIWSQEFLMVLLVAILVVLSESAD